MASEMFECLMQSILSKWSKCSDKEALVTSRRKLFFARMKLKSWMKLFHYNIWHKSYFTNQYTKHPS